MGRLTRAAVALAVAVIPLAPLYCPSDEPAAMACCANRANTCNQATAPDDDCCRDAPADGQTLSASGALRVEVAPAPALASTRLIFAVATAETPTPHPMRPPGFASPPPHPPPILRI